MAAKYKIIPEVVSFCLNGTFFKDMEGFFANYPAGTFGPPEEKEHRLIYTEIHKSWTEVFERKIEDFIKNKGSTPEKFYALCKTVSEMKNESMTAFITLLFQCLEFSTFIDMAKDKAKRDYFYSIMNSYGKLLAAQGITGDKKKA